jgi:hypothetical protein
MDFLMMSEIQKKHPDFIIYETDDNVAKVSVRLEEVQNKMHYAVHRQTAAEVVFHRVDNEKAMLGMTKISHQQAVEKAEKEFEIYRQREMRQLESDFDRAVKKLASKKSSIENQK